MTSPHLDQSAPRARPHPLATVALLTAFLFGCTTIRTPVAALGGPIPVRDGLAEPQLALWLESAEPVSPEEAAAAEAKARAAIAGALEGRTVGDGSTLLVVRAQGVTRTPSHRSDQTAATVGLVLGAVVVVVAIVVLLAEGKGGGGGKSVRGAGPAARGAGIRPPPVSPALPVAAAGRAAPVRAGAAGLAARPAPVRPPSGPRPAPSPRLPPVEHRRLHAPAITAGVYVDVGPLPLPADPGPMEVVSSRELGALEPLAAPGEAAPAEAAGAAPAGLEQVHLPPFAPLPLEERGFFAGDALVLELTLVDRVTGEARWTKWVEAEADPCDAEAVRRILDEALGEPPGWVAAP